MHSEDREREAYVREARQENEARVARVMGERGLAKYRELCRRDAAPLNRDPVELVRAAFTREALWVEIGKAEGAGCVTMDIAIADLKLLLKLGDS
jgi:hypothetical protein